MSDSDRRIPTMPPQREAREVIYAFGRSTLGDFIAAIDKNGLCAILFGDDHADLLDELRDALPDRNLTEACPTYGGFLASAVARLIERPSMAPVFPTSIADGDFGQMVRAALRITKSGETITPEGITEMIGASPLAAGNVWKLAAAEPRALRVEQVG